DIIILNEYQMTLHVAVFAQMDDVLNESLAIVIARMGFARENELNWTRTVAGEAHDIFKLLKNQRGALVSREAAREANGQRIRIQQLIERDEISLRQALPLNGQTPAREFDQLAAQPITQRPDFLVRNERRISHFLPEIRRIDRLVPAGAGIFAPEARAVACRSIERKFFTSISQLVPPETAHGTFHPAQQMNPVRDMSNGHLIDRQLGIKRLPHMAADAPVQLA